MRCIVWIEHDGARSSANIGGSAFLPVNVGGSGSLVVAESFGLLPGVPEFPQGNLAGTDVAGHQVILHFGAYRRSGHGGIRIQGHGCFDWRRSLRGMFWFLRPARLPELLCAGAGDQGEKQDHLSRDDHKFFRIMGAFHTVTGRDYAPNIRRIRQLSMFPVKKEKYGVLTAFLFTQIFADQPADGAEESTPLKTSV